MQMCLLRSSGRDPSSWAFACTRTDDGAEVALGGVSGVSAPADRFAFYGGFAAAAPPRAPPAPPVLCENDPGWSAFGAGTYTCAWWAPTACEWWAPTALSTHGVATAPLDRPRDRPLLHRHRRRALLLPQQPDLTPRPPRVCGHWRGDWQLSL